MPGEAYDTLAAVYDWLVPDDVLTPEGSAATFVPYLDTPAPGARVLDCAAGTGQLAVGLALRGFEVVASDASGAMVQRTRALAARHGAALTARTCAWEDLERQGWAPFDAVLCIGNSITHAAGHDARQAALRAMAGVMRPGALLALTSRNWERVREGGSGVHVADELVVRDAVPSPRRRGRARRPRRPGDDARRAPAVLAVPPRDARRGPPGGRAGARGEHV
jgi:2-polyprenyl-3-methyl-5-hydroxy-6-metoxy-1,4-benzoquinol methylase